MSDLFDPERPESASASLDDALNDQAPQQDELPPVEPPSAGFIFRLFLVPALIVVAVVGVWALFGQLASVEQDWRSLVAELRSNVGPGGNEHRLWRAALGLAQMLKADSRLAPDDQTLTRNPQIAAELTALLERELDQPSGEEEAVKQRAFLARTLGWLDVPETVVPALQDAMQPRHHREVRKSALEAIANIAGRTAERGDALETPGLVPDLIEISGDEDLLIRRRGAYVLGLVPGDAARDRLIVLLDDADEMTRLNAAVALARKDSKAGWPVLRSTLIEGTQPIEPDALPATTPEERRRQLHDRTVERFTALKTSIRAAGALADKLTREERNDLGDLLQPLADEHPQPRIRIEATKVLQML